MNEPAPMPPPPPSAQPGPPAPPAQSVTAPLRWPHPVALFAVAASIASASGVAIGVLAGLLSWSAGSSNCTPNDGWCDLGAALLGLAVGVLIGGITYVVAGVTTIVRSRPRGRRAGYVVAVLGFPVALIGGLTLLGMAISELT